MITQFQLISLCNTLYKLVSRIILQRLKPYIAKIINPCQAGFVPSRRTSDNIILVQEIICTLVRKGGKRSYVALKLDLDKAYDRLEWSFIQESLEFFQVLPTLIKHDLLNAISYSVEWISALNNGPQQGSASGRSVIPISLYFVLRTHYSFGRGSSGQYDPPHHVQGTNQNITFILCR